VGAELYRNLLGNHKNDRIYSYIQQKYEKP
jgi:hypothetical protein